MNLKEFRKLFVETSGRYDLWNDDGSDNGANYYINCGLKYIETIVFNGKMYAIKNLFLDNCQTFMLENVRVIEDIYIKLLPAGKLKRLERITISHAKEIQAKYSDASGCYFFVPFRSRGQVETNEMVNFFANLDNYQDFIVGQSYDSVGIMLIPGIITGEFMVEVHGLFRENDLKEETDSNYWLQRWPNILLYATQRELEISNRNSQGVADWDRAISAISIQLDMDEVMDEASSIDRILG